MSILSWLAERIAPGDDNARQMGEMLSGPAVVAGAAAGFAAITPMVGMAARSAVAGMNSVVSGGVEIPNDMAFADLPPPLPSNAPSLVAQTGVGAGLGA